MNALVFCNINPLPRTKNKCSISQFHHQAPMFSQVNLYFSHHFCCHLMNLPFRHQSMTYFSQSIRNMSIVFLSLIGFLRVNWNVCVMVLSIIEVLQLWYNCNHHCVKSVRIRSYSVRMRENVEQNNFEYGHFLRSAQQWWL